MLEEMLQREPPPEFASDELRLRETLKELPKGAPEKVPLFADLTELLFESGFGSRQPEASVAACSASARSTRGGGC